MGSERPHPLLSLADNDDSRPVNLLWDDKGGPQTLEVEGVQEPAAILVHSTRIITHVGRQIQRIEGSRTHASDALAEPNHDTLLRQKP
jgi:hypothetical protein